MTPLKKDRNKILSILSSNIARSRTPHFILSWESFLSPGVPMPPWWTAVLPPAGIYHLLSSVGFSSFSSFTRWTYCYSPAKFIPACREHERGVVALMREDDSCLWALRRATTLHPRIRDIYPYYKQRSCTPHTPCTCPADTSDVTSSSPKVLGSRLVHAQGILVPH